MKSSIILKIYIRGFDKKTQDETPNVTVKYLEVYYQFIERHAAQFGWRFIKGMGDSVLVSAENANSINNIELFSKAISKEYDLSIQYRACDFIEWDCNIGGYSCIDVVGKDINNLFRDDSETIRVR